MTKLSRAQQEIMEKAYKDIDKARNAEDLVEWYRKCISASWLREMSHEDLVKEFEKDNSKDWWTKYYNELINGIVHTHANGKSLYRLQELGLIEIIVDMTNHGRYDVVKILNY